MSWAPPSLSHNPQTFSILQSTSPHTTCRNQYLAVTNDANGVAILHIRSPWCLRGRVWEAQVTHYTNWEDLVLVNDSTANKSSFQNGISSIGATEEGPWSSLFANCCGKKTFIDQVTCTPRMTPPSVFGLILRKDWQTLRFDVPYDVVSGVSSADQWIPLSYCTTPTPCQVRFPSFSCGAASLIGKVLCPFLHLTTWN